MDQKNDSPGFSAISFPDNTGDKQSQGTSNQKYYGVQLSESMNKPFQNIGEPLIFSKKLDAINAIKKFHDSRFREFSTYEEAVAYASSILPSSLSGRGAPSVGKERDRERVSLSHTHTERDEKNSSWKSVSSQDLVYLRRQIEEGNETNFYNIVWSNPRFLVSSIDCPTTLQAGTHTNALHAAAKHLQTDICLAVLNTLYDLRFINLLYSDGSGNPIVIERERDDVCALMKKRERILDLYLNTPDKSLGETPLHYACKFGAVEIVRILLSYKWCEKDRRNKYNLRPVDIIGSRADSQICSDDMICEIRSMFEDSSCIPILKNLHKFAESSVGEPCANFVKEELLIRSYVKKSNLLPCAFAGPMSNSDARDFYLACKRKNFSELPQYSTDDEREFKEICRSDPIKGLERVGRKLAKDFNCPWVEFWPFLHAWVDFESYFGLRLLESHLRCHAELKILLDFEESQVVAMDRKSDALMFLLVDNGLVHIFCNIVNYIIEHEIKQNFLQLFQSLMPETICLTYCSFSWSEYLMNIHEEIAHIMYLKLSSQGYMTFSILHSFIMQINAKLDLVPHITNGSESKNWKFLICIIRNLIYLHHTHVLPNQTEMPCVPLTFKPTCFCDWNCKSDFYTFDSSITYFKLVNIRQDLYNKMFIEETSNDSSLPSAEAGPSQKESESSISSSIFGLGRYLRSFLSIKPFKNPFIETEKCAPELTPDEEFFTPPESPIKDFPTPQFSCRSQNVYLNGSKMSDDDIDVFRAIEKLPINGELYPNLLQWKALMEFKLGRFLRSSNDLYRTPPLASATLNRRLSEIGGTARRLLF